MGLAAAGGTCSITYATSFVSYQPTAQFSTYFSRLSIYLFIYFILKKKEERGTEAGRPRSISLSSGDTDDNDLEGGTANRTRPASTATSVLTSANPK